MACCLMAPSHYLNQCWLIISRVQRHLSEGNFTIDTSGINHWNYLENYLSKNSFKSPRGQWVKSSHCNWFEDHAPVDFVLIFKWVAETWFHDTVPGYQPKQRPLGNMPHWGVTYTRCVTFTGGFMVFISLLGLGYISFISIKIMSVI